MVLILERDDSIVPSCRQRGHERVEAGRFCHATVTVHVHAHLKAELVLILGQTDALLCERILILQFYGLLQHFYDEATDSVPVLVCQSVVSLYNYITLELERNRKGTNALTSHVLL